MAKCKFKFRQGAWEWECPLEALPGEEYCYWHKEEEGKEPDDTKLRELKENEIWGVFLRKAELSLKELQNAFLSDANLQGEINEIVADFLKRRNKELTVLDVKKIKEDNSKVVARLHEEGLVRYVCGGEPIVDRLFVYVPVGEPIVFFDRKRRRVVKILGNVEIGELNDLIERNGLEKYFIKEA